MREVEHRVRFGKLAPQMQASSSTGFRFRYKTGIFLRFGFHGLIRRQNRFILGCPMDFRRSHIYPPEQGILRILPFPDQSTILSEPPRLIGAEVNQRIIR
jgi:hypothetical protein